MNPRRIAVLLFLQLLASLAVAQQVVVEEEGVLKPAYAFGELPGLPQPLEGYFLGRSGSSLIVAGGTLVENGQPAPQRAIYVLHPGSAAWEEAGALPYSRADGASATDGGGLIMAGGLVDGAPTASVQRVSLSGGGVTVTDLPDLPEAIERPGATTGGGFLWVAGATDSGAGGNEAFFARLGLGPRGTQQWETLPSFPGSPRRAPILAFSFDRILLMAGYENGAPVRDGFSYHPRLGWRSIAPPPEFDEFAAASALGESHVFFFPGEGSAGTSDPRIHTYHTLTDAWVVSGQWPGATPARAKAVTVGDTIHIVAPGRTSSVTVLPPANNYGTLDHIVVGVYLLLMIGMGAWFVRREKNTQDYFRGGNRLPWWAIGMSLFATAASAISLMTMPGKSYSENWTYFSISVFSVICLPLSMFLLAPLVRKLNIATANEYLELRFGLTARMVGSVIFIINQILARMAPIIFLPSIAMAAITGIDIWVWILVVGSVTTLYTFMGGLSAVIWTDTVQGLIMLLTVAGCLILILFKIDMPFSDMWQTLQSYEKLHTFDWELDVTYPTVWMVFIGTVFITLLGISDQNYVQRVQAAKDLRQAKKAIGTQMAVAVPINVLLFSMGTALFLYYRSHPEQLNPLMKTDGVYPLFAAQHLPVGVSGLVIAALLAASMSTVSSAISSVANLGVDDFFRRFMRQQPSDRTALRLARGLSLSVGVAGVLGALYLSQTDSTSVWDLALLISGLITNGTVGFFGLGLLTRRAHQWGALTGVASGMLLVFWLQAYTPVTFWLYAVVGSIITFVVGYVASLVIPGKPAAVAGLTVYTLDQQRPYL